MSDKLDLILLLAKIWSVVDNHPKFRALTVDGGCDAFSYVIKQLFRNGNTSRFEGVDMLSPMLKGEFHTILYDKKTKWFFDMTAIQYISTDNDKESKVFNTAIQNNIKAIGAPILFGNFRYFNSLGYFMPKRGSIKNVFDRFRVCEYREMKLPDLIFALRQKFDDKIRPLM